MTGLVKKVRDVLGSEKCIIRGGLNKDGCRILMAGAPKPRLIVDFDKLGAPLAPNETRCDYLLIAEGQREYGWVAPLELKRGQLHCDQAVRQLRAGACAAERLVPRDEAVRFRPVVVSGRVSKHERKRLRNRQNRIRLHGHTEHVRLMSCGAPLVAVLRS